MRQNKYGSNVSFKDELTDIIADALPRESKEVEDAIDSFLNSKDMDRMLDNIADTIQEHIDYNIDSRKITE